MPYSLPVHSEGRTGHRRSYSQATLGDRGTPVVTTKFHFRQDEPDEDEESSSHDENNRLRGLPPLRLKLNSNSFDAVPFPRSSPRSSPLPSPPLRPSPSALLSNRKPLKSSLKSSSSSPNIPFPPQSLVPSIMFPDLHPKHHQRASSAPCTPLLGSASSSPSSSPPSSHSHSPSSSHVSKNVHFPSQEGGLATIRLFNRSARPASLSRLGEETETETEGEGSSTGYGSWAGWSGKYVGGSAFPFPRVPEKEKERKSPLNPHRQKSISYDIDWSQSSVIPRKNLNLGNENIFFESLQVVSAVDSETVLQGTLLVRNITYQKTVMVRYTMDEWETVNDVLGWYHAGSSGVERDREKDWDRFKFSISLGGSQEVGLEKRVLWLVAKYAGESQGQQRGQNGDVEWWDNNEGKNYKIGFRKLEVPVEPEESEKEEKVYKRGVVVSAPPTYTSSTPTPTSTLTRPRLSAPQISASSSYPSTKFSGQQERERERERALQQAALTQSTLARLKKLNLKNYAAPRGYSGQQQSFSVTTETAPHPHPPPGLTLPALTLTSALNTTCASPPESSPIISTDLSLNTTLEISSSPTLSTVSMSTTSVDSTPVQTPTHEDDDEGWKAGGDDDKEEKDRLRWSLGMENGQFATTLLPPGNDSFGVSSSPPIPISIPGGSGRRGYPFTSYPHPSAAPAASVVGTSPPFSDLEGMRKGKSSVYWNWGSAAAAAGVALRGGEGGKERTNLWMNQPGLMPPQRRRGLVQRTSGSSSSSGSGSDSSNTKSLKLTSGSTLLSSSSLSPSASTSTPTPSSPAASIPPKPKPTPPTRTFTPSFVAAAIGRVQSPYQGMQRFGRLPPGGGGGEEAGSSDAIYQALVREWCFAQGPGPVVGVVLESGQTTPVPVGVGKLASPLSEGE